ncbi:MAG: glycosyltransferase family 39 protein [Dehalococcoidia bacterium]
MAVADPELTARSTGVRTHRREALAIAIALCVLNLILLVRVHNEAEDSIGYLENIRRGVASDIFNPYHLVHSWLGWIAFRIADGAGYDGGPLVPVQAMNAVFGAAGIGLLWLLMRTAVDGRLAAAAATGVVGLSYGYWAYSLGADVYAFSAMTLILALFAAYRAALDPSLPRFAILGLATGATVLAHNTNVLFGVVGVTAILLATRDPRLMLRFGAAYAAAVVVMVVPLYLVALATVDANTPSEANEWLTDYAQSGEWGVISAQSAPKAAVGAARAFVGGLSAFALDDVRDLADRASGNQSLREETYLVRDYPRELAVVLLAASAAAVAALALLAMRWLRRPALDRPARTLALLSLAWLVPYAVFVTWWEPVNPEFWIALWVPAAILIAVPLAGDGARATGLVFILLGALFIVNLAGNIAPQLTEENDYWRERTAWYESETSPGDLVVTNGFIQSAYLRYFAHADVLDIDEWDIVETNEALEEIDDLIQASDASRVLFSKEAFLPASDEYSDCQPGTRPCLYIADALRQRFEPRSRVVYESELETVWELVDR